MLGSHFECVLNYIFEKQFRLQSNALLPSCDCHGNAAFQACRLHVELYVFWQQLLLVI